MVCGLWSHLMYPLLFQPIFQERVWGGRELERLYRKALPPGKKIGESWEITDRPEAMSRIANGPWRDRTLRWLLDSHGPDVLGRARAASGHFPLLIKILDARDTLSLQVHPPPIIARRLGGEPKTEMWYIAAADPGAELFVGLKRGVSREEFARKTGTGTVAECLHRLPVQPGDAIFLPSGRVHAIGGGNVIFEIQQNSDTTYRVFDWNRVGLDGKPRALHVEESLASIDFNDFEPGLIRAAFDGEESVRRKPLVRDRLFEVDLLEARAASDWLLDLESFVVLGVVSGRLEVGQTETAVVLPGQYCLVPASLGRVKIGALAGTRVLEVRGGK